MSKRLFFVREDGFQANCDSRDSYSRSALEAAGYVECDEEGNPLVSEEEEAEGNGEEASVENGGSSPASDDEVPFDDQPSDSEDGDVQPEVAGEEE